ncbi:trans-sialidase [Trypanosoma cruzi cruzi]|uniref:Putative trans-sialidase, Group V n=1 Tax=Trypanosoma cruzi TaxID=5693 RepID=A0A2V2VY18_TRYCR|nr:trans-sialidase [Trypanosoma cruzi cruzi]PWV00985.1 putative trans-sialidase, Group V [Trypanosoma cruzi]
MLSRVAAVMAPRTHNRRGVTGSSGRRREGGESERQRPNMSRRVFTSAVLLVVVMMCDTGRAAQAAEPTSGQGSSPSPSFVWRDKKDGETVDSLYVPSLVEVNGGVFAVAVALLKKDENENSHFFTGIASELLALSEKKPKELAAANVKTKILENCSSQEEGKCPSQSTKQDASQSEMKVYVSRPTTVVKGNDIYMLAGTYIRENFAVCQGGPGAASWGLLLVKGNVSDTEGKEIVWEDTDGLPCTSIVGLHKSLTGEIGSGGSGVKMDDGALVFPLEAVKKEEGDAGKDGKTVSLIIYSSDTLNWTLSKGMSADGCSDPSVVEWKEDKLMMMTACDDGRRRVYESGDKGDSWTEALGTLSRVWGNNQKRHEKGVRSGFITATIEDRNVMLVTLPVYSKKDDTEVNEKENKKGELRLWLTDNTHIVDIGTVSGEGDDVAASALLYKSGNNKELIALYEKKGAGWQSSPGMFSVRLTEQLQRVKDVLTTWKEVDERVSKLCPTSIAEKDVSSDTACATDKITEGLVGFLSGEFSGDTWMDEYLGVNATVTGAATKSESSGGITFKGRGAWAEWPVGEQGENQLYHFANYNFTLVATVSIHGEKKRDTPIPLMGVRADSDGGTKLMELSYGSGKKWQALCSDGTTAELNSTWDPETQYQVAIVLQNGTQGSVYVDGQRVCGSAQRGLENTESKGISHFYIGGDGGSAGGQGDVSVTVRNVLLYNRPLTFSGPDAEVEKDVASPAGAVSRTKTGDEIKTEGKPATTQQVPTASSSHAVGEAADNAGFVRGSGLLPSLLLLLGLWGFAAL